MDAICGWLRAVRGVRSYSCAAEVQASQAVKKAGYMVKKGHTEGWANASITDIVTMRELRKGDKRRWVVLKGNGEMIYYKDEHTNHPQNRFNLEPQSVTVDHSLDPPELGASSPTMKRNLYLIKFTIGASRRTWLLGLDTERERTEWFDQLQPWIT